MIKTSRLRKLSLRVIFIYIVAIFLVAFARPNPSQPYFMAGLFLILIGVLIRGWAAGHLSKNKLLCTSGPYAHVKNPLYTGTLFVTSGICIIAQGGGQAIELFNFFNWIVLGVFLVFFIFYYAPYKKKRESQRLEASFKEDWHRYNASVPDYLPSFKPYRFAQKDPWSLSNFLENSEHWTILAIAAIALAIYFNHHIMLIYF